jgi:hypothetical protein
MAYNAGDKIIVDATTTYGKCNVFRKVDINKILNCPTGKLRKIPSLKIIIKIH